MSASYSQGSVCHREVKQLLEFAWPGHGRVSICISESGSCAAFILLHNRLPLCTAACSGQQAHCLQILCLGSWFLKGLPSLLQKEGGVLIACRVTLTGLQSAHGPLASAKASPDSLCQARLSYPETAPGCVSSLFLGVMVASVLQCDFENDLCKIATYFIERKGLIHSILDQQLLHCESTSSQEPG